MFIHQVRAWIYQAWTWLFITVRPFAAQVLDKLKLEYPRGEPPETRSSKPDSSKDAQPTGDPTECASRTAQPGSAQFVDDPYTNLPVIAVGMTGHLCKLGEDRVVKRPKEYQRGAHRDDEGTEYLNEMNRQILMNEIQVYERLGSHQGITPCLQTSKYGIELPLAQGDLEDYLGAHPEPGDTLKTNWIMSLIETFLHVHSQKIFVDDIALRNILVLGGQLRLADFGQSIILPLDTDITTVVENDLNARIEILHLGWVFYSIASWKVHKYHFFSPENPESSWPSSFPCLDGVLFGKIIKKCWHGEYRNMELVKDEACELLNGPVSVDSVGDAFAGCRP